jgi:isochorismate hydrolase
MKKYKAFKYKAKLLCERIKNSRLMMIITGILGFLSILMILLRTVWFIHDLFAIILIYFI